MIPSNNRYSIISKAIVLALVCTFSAQTIAFAGPGTLAIPGANSADPEKVYQEMQEMMTERAAAKGAVPAGTRAEAADETARVAPKGPPPTDTQEEFISRLHSDFNKEIFAIMECSNASKEISGFQYSEEISAVFRKYVIKIFEFCQVTSTIRYNVAFDKVMLCASGGTFFRGEMSPLSDVDYAIVFDERLLPFKDVFLNQFELLVKRVTDVKTDLHDVSAIEKAIRRGYVNVIDFSIARETMFLAGDYVMYHGFEELLQNYIQQARSRDDYIIENLMFDLLYSGAKWEEVGASEDKVNIKKHRGGLRSINKIIFAMQLIEDRIGLLERGPGEIDNIISLTLQEKQSLKNAENFLLSVRNTLHYVSMPNLTDLFDLNSARKITDIVKWAGSPVRLNEQTHSFLESVAGIERKIRELATAKIKSLAGGAWTKTAEQVLSGMVAEEDIPANNISELSKNNDLVSAILTARCSREMVELRKVYEEHKGNWTVSMFLAINEYTPADILSKLGLLSGYDNRDIRMSVAFNRASPDRILAQLMDDKIINVQAAARISLIKRYPDISQWLDVWSPEKQADRLKAEGAIPQVDTLSMPQQAPGIAPAETAAAAPNVAAPESGAAANVAMARLFTPDQDALSRNLTRYYLFIAGSSEMSLAFAEHWQRAKTYADFGCGIGQAPLEAADNDRVTAYGIDVVDWEKHLTEKDWPNFDWNEFRARKERLRAAGRYEFLTGDIANVKLPRKIDLATCFFTLYYMPDPLAGVKNMFDQIAIDGALFAILIIPVNRDTIQYYKQAIRNIPGACIKPIYSVQHSQNGEDVCRYLLYLPRTSEQDAVDLTGISLVSSREITLQFPEERFIIYDPSYANRREHSDGTPGAAPAETAAPNAAAPESDAALDEITDRRTVLEKSIRSVLDDQRRIPLISVDLDGTLIPYGAAIDDNTLDKIIAYVERGGIFAFNSLTDIEWLYRRVLDKLANKLHERGEAYLLSRIPLILSRGLNSNVVEIYLYENGAYMLAYNAYGTKSDGLLQLMKLLESRGVHASLLAAYGDRFAEYKNDGNLIGKESIRNIVNVGHPVDDAQRQRIFNAGGGPATTSADITFITGKLSYPTMDESPRAAENVAVWTFDNKDSFDASPESVVKIVVGEPGIGAPGFVWAGVASLHNRWDLDNLWDTDNRYLIPLMKNQDGRYEAVLPKWCNVFTFFWPEQGQDRPGHWEGRNFYTSEVVFTKTNNPAINEQNRNLLKRWISKWAAHNGIKSRFIIDDDRGMLRIRDEHNRRILGVEYEKAADALRITGQNTDQFNKKRLMALTQAFLIYNFNASNVVYDSLTIDGRRLVDGMSRIGIFSYSGSSRLSTIVNSELINSLVHSESALDRFIAKESIDPGSAAPAAPPDAKPPEGKVLVSESAAFPQTAVNTDSVGRQIEFAEVPGLPTIADLLQVARQEKITVLWNIDVGDPQYALLLLGWACEDYIKKIERGEEFSRDDIERFRDSKFYSGRFFDRIELEHTAKESSKSYAEFMNFLGLSTETTSMVVIAKDGYVGQFAHRILMHEIFHALQGPSQNPEDPIWVPLTEEARVKKHISEEVTAFLETLFYPQEQLEYFNDSDYSTGHLAKMEALWKRYLDELGFDPNYQMRDMLQALLEDVRQKRTVLVKGEEVEIARILSGADFVNAYLPLYQDKMIERIQRILEREKFSHTKPLFLNWHSTVRLGKGESVSGGVTSQSLSVPAETAAPNAAAPESGAVTSDADKMGTTLQNIEALLNNISQENLPEQETGRISAELSQAMISIHPGVDMKLDLNNQYGNVRMMVDGKPYETYTVSTPAWRRKNDIVFSRKGMAGEYMTSIPTNTVNELSLVMSGLVLDANRIAVTPADDTGRVMVKVKFFGTGTEPRTITMTPRLSDTRTLVAILTAGIALTNADLLYKWHYEQFPADTSPAHPTDVFLAKLDDGTSAGEAIAALKKMCRDDPAVTRYLLEGIPYARLPRTMKNAGLPTLARLLLDHFEDSEKWRVPVSWLEHIAPQIRCDMARISFENYVMTLFEKTPIVPAEAIKSVRALMEREKKEWTHPDGESTLAVTIDSFLKKHSRQLTEETAAPESGPTSPTTRDGLGLRRASAAAERSYANTVTHDMASGGRLIVNYDILPGSSKGGQEISGLILEWLRMPETADNLLNMPINETMFFTNSGIEYTMSEWVRHHYKAPEGWCVGINRHEVVKFRFSVWDKNGREYVDPGYIRYVPPTEAGAAATPVADVSALKSGAAVKPSQDANSIMDSVYRECKAIESTFFKYFRKIFPEDPGSCKAASLMLSRLLARRLNLPMHDVNAPNRIALEPGLIRPYVDAGKDAAHLWVVVYIDNKPTLYIDATTGQLGKGKFNTIYVGDYEKSIAYFDLLPPEAAMEYVIARDLKKHPNANEANLRRSIQKIRSEAPYSYIVPDRYKNFESPQEAPTFSHMRVSRLQLCSFYEDDASRGEVAELCGMVERIMRDLKNDSDKRAMEIDPKESSSSGGAAASDAAGASDLIDEAWEMVEEAFRMATVKVNIERLAQAVNECQNFVEVKSREMVADDKTGVIFSESVTFGDEKDGKDAQGLGIVLPEFANRGIRVAVLLSSDRERRAYQEALIEKLNQKIDDPGKRIRYGTSVSEIGAGFANLKDERPVRFYYLKTGTEPKIDGVVDSISIVVREILRILGRICGIVEDGQEPQKLYDAAKKFSQAA